MLENLSAWISHYQPTGFALIVILLCCALLILWNDLRQQKNIIAHMYGHSQKALNELAQQRYALASLRQAIIKPDVEVTEQHLLDEALNQLDGLLKSMPDEKQEQTSGPQDLSQLKERDILAFVRKALKDNQVALAVQPIKAMPYRQIRFYEVFARIKLGDHYLPAGKFLSIAKNHGLLATIDQSFFLKTLELVKKQAKDDFSVSYFCNLSADSFSNKKLMDAIIKYLASQPRLSSRLIFELTQDDTFHLGPMAKKTFEKLIELGCRFSMDNVKMLGLDIARLRELHLSFVKFDINAALAEIDNAAGKRRWVRLKSLLAEQGIEIIVEKIENARQLDKLKEASPDYAQGYHLGEPEIVI